MKTKMKVSAMLILSSLMIGVIGCSRDEMEVEPEAIEEPTKVKSNEAIMNFTYHYKGQTFSTDAWENYLSSNPDQNNIYVGLNENIYAFDNAREAKFFRTGKFKDLVDAKKIALSKTNNSGEASTRVHWKIEFFPDDNFQPYSFGYEWIGMVDRVYTVWGPYELQNNLIRYTIPSNLHNLISSYKIYLLDTGSVIESGVQLAMYTECYDKPLGEEDVSLDNTIAASNPYTEDNDLSDEGLLLETGFLPTISENLSWTDAIDAFEVEMR